MHIRQTLQGNSLVLPGRAEKYATTKHRKGRNMQSRKGIDHFQLKILGIILMTFDHLGAFLVTETPVWFGWLGRPVAIIFLSGCAEGYQHTRNKAKYLRNLLVGFWVMNFGNFLLGKLFPVEGVELYANIFGALFWSVLSMLLVDTFTKNVRLKRYFVCVGIAAFVLLSLFMGIALIPIMDINLTLGVLLFNLIPIPMFVEGGILYILIALLFYLFREKRGLQLLTIVGASAIFLISSMGAGNLLTENYQWMAIFSVIPIALYNGEKGKSMKSFFYLYYPLHIYGIYMISYWISRTGI